MKNPIDKDKITEHPNTIEYPHNVGSALIKPENTNSFKNRGINKVNKEITNRLILLKKEYDDLIEELEWNKIIYSSEIKFEPIVGESYFLYENSKGTFFLSLIPPNKWNKKFISEFFLNHDLKWVKKNNI